MQVRVLFFGMMADAAGHRSQNITLPHGATLADLLAHCAEKFPPTKKFFSSIAVSVNQEYAERSKVLHEGDEVALLPPVSGGAPAQQSAPPSEKHPTVLLVRAKIETQRIVDSIKRPEDGAVAVFEGIVRNHSRGRRTLYLEYEAYEEMALNKMRELAQEVGKKFEIRDAAVIHRLGRLEIGETSVLIVVASAHRAAAFDACRWLIDTLKQTVPIWKKEFFEDGSVWAPGEPLMNSSV